MRTENLMRGALGVGVAILAVQSLFACTGFYVGKRVSEDGCVLVARTVDLPPWTTSHRLKIVPRVENAPGRVYEGVNGCRWELPATTLSGMRRRTTESTATAAGRRMRRRNRSVCASLDFRVLS